MSEAEPKPAAAPARQDDLEIWVVVRGNPSEKFPEGLLVTTRDRVPRLVAYINRVDQPGILSAKLIASGKASPETEENLRGCIECRPDSFAHCLCRWTTSKGATVIVSAPLFIQIRPNSAPNFVTYNESGFKAAYMNAAEKLKSAGETGSK